MTTPTPSPAAAPADDLGSLLTIAELAVRLRYAVKTVRNLQSQGEFVEGVHYFRPGGKRRPLYSWAAVEVWLRSPRSATASRQGWPSGKARTP